MVLRSGHEIYILSIIVYANKEHFGLESLKHCINHEIQSVSILKLKYLAVYLCFYIGLI